MIELVTLLLINLEKRIFFSEYVEHACSFQKGM